MEEPTAVVEPNVAETNSTDKTQVKRSLRACAACKKGKNKCSGDTPCARCFRLKLNCAYDRPMVSDPAVRRIAALEDQIAAFSSRLAHLEGLLNIRTPDDASFSAIFRTDQTLPSTFGANDIASRHDLLLHAPMPSLIETLPNNQGDINFETRYQPPDGNKKRRRTEAHPSSTSVQAFPPLPGYSAPQHPEAQYSLNILPSRAPSDDEDEVVSSHALRAPFEALAEAAVQSSQSIANHSGDVNQSMSPRSFERGERHRRRQPAPPHAFADACQKGIVDERQARQNFDYFLTHLHRWLPILDPSQSFDVFKRNTAFCFTALQYVSRRAKQGDAQNATLQQLSEEAHGIARSTLFALTTRTHSVQAVTMLAAFSSNGYLSSAHALTMALEFGLHRAMAKLTDGTERTPDEVNELYVAARTWYGLYLLSYRFAKCSGRPILLSEETAIQTAHLDSFLRHPLANQNDKTLIASVELMMHQSRTQQAIESFGYHSTGNALPANVMQFFRHSRKEIQDWYQRWDFELAKNNGPHTFERQELLRTFCSAKIFLSTTALNGKSIMRVEEPNIRELASQAFYAAHETVNIVHSEPEYRKYLEAAPHIVHCDIAFSALLLLKLCRLFIEPNELAQTANRVQSLAEMLCKFAGGLRLSNTLQIALRRFSQDILASSVVNSMNSDLSMFNTFTNLDVANFDEGFHFNALYPEWNQWNPSDTNLFKATEWSFGDNGIDSLFQPVYQLDGAASAQAW